MCINKIDTKVDTIGDVDRIASNLDTIIKVCMTKSVSNSPSIDKSKRNKLPPHIVNIIKEKRKLRRRYILGHDPDVKTQINRLRKVIDREIKHFKNNLDYNTCKNLRPNNDAKLFWNTVKKILDLKDSNPVNMAYKITDNGIDYVSTSEKLRCFKNFFENIFTDNDSKLFRECPTYEGINNWHKHMAFDDNHFKPSKRDFCEIIEPITLNEFEKILKSCKNTSPGHDKITYNFIKTSSNFFKTFIINLYNNCLSLGHFPQIWKKAIITLLRKPGKDTSHPSGYRPVSLLPVFGKLFEKIIANRLKNALEISNFFNKFQAGFRSGFCTGDQILKLIYHIKNNNLQHKYTLAAFFDVEKAFDKVWHHGLIYKLFTTKIKHGNKTATLPMNFIKLINCFLINRTIQIRINKELSEPFSPKAGTPQGSPLSPLLFLIYVNDIPTPSNPHISMSQFADDIAIWAPSRGRSDDIVLSLQEYVSSVAIWCNEWGIKLNALKSKTIVFNGRRAEIDFRLHMEGTRIPIHKEVTFLGVTFDSRITFTPHFNKIISDINKRLNALFRITGSYTNPRAPPKTGKIIYTTFIRSIIDYSFLIFPAWNKSKQETLEHKQIMALKMINHLPRWITPRAVTSVNDLPTIAERTRKLFNNFSSKRTIYNEHPFNELNTHTLAVIGYNVPE